MYSQCISCSQHYEQRYFPHIHQDQLGTSHICINSDYVYSHSCVAYLSISEYAYTAESSRQICNQNITLQKCNQPFHVVDNQGDYSWLVLPIFFFNCWYASALMCSVRSFGEVCGLWRTNWIHKSISHFAVTMVSAFFGWLGTMCQCHSASDTGQTEFCIIQC